jgi:catechol 2,3-dioxygenase-like lactoylglutathione lyase family enzyme
MQKGSEAPGGGGNSEVDIRIHHVGFAVDNIKEYLDRFLAPLVKPQSVSATIEDPIQRVRVAFVKLEGGTIELIEAMDDSSPVSEIVKKRRGGLYHLCFATSQFDAMLVRFTNLGCLPLSDPVPAAAFGNRRLVFFLTPKRDLFELIETA